MSSTPANVIPASRGRASNDPIFHWSGEGKRRAAAGEDILNATMGALMNDDGSLCVIPTVLETLKRFQTAETAGYAPIKGLPAYREAVLRDCFGDSPLASQATAVVSPGGSGAVYATVVNFLEKGQKMLLPEFYWGPYSVICSHSERELDPFRMFADDGSFNVAGMAEGLDRHLAEQGRALVVLNFPCHNPTGYSLSASEWDQVVDVISKAGQRGPVTVLIDVAYMEYGGELARSWVDPIPALMEHATVVVAWTASKSMCQYGARTGAIVGLHSDPAELEQIDNALGFTARSTWSNCNHLGQRAVTALLTEPELVSRLAAERGAIADLLNARIARFNELAAAASLPVPRFDAGFFVTVFTPDQDATGAAMRELGVYTVPIPGAVRIAICSTPESAMPRLVSAVEAGLAAVV